MSSQKKPRRWWQRLFGRRELAPLQAPGNEALAQHSDEFRREIIQVVDGVYVGVGYGLANSIMLVGDQGRVIVDTLGSVEAAQVLKADFDKISNKPVEAIIYTHNHTDHIFGAGVFAQDDEPEIYAHVTTSAYIDKIASMLRPVITRRSMRQFGVFLDKADHLNCGIGPALETGPEATLALLRPTHTFHDTLPITLAGIRMELVHAPGETADHLFIWLPDKQVMLAADNFYRAFPNLYAIRGTAYRDVMQWVHSIDRMRSYQPAYLVPCHTRPLVGKDEIAKALTDYRDAIQFVHDQTIRHMNKGLTPDEIVERVKLPPHLASSPYLQEFYGTVAWSVRSIFSGYLGWFGGNPSELDRHPPAARAERMARLAGGVDGLKRQCAEALEQADYPWVLELTDHLLTLQANDSQAITWRVEALKGMATQHTSANGRNYYLTQALELQGLSIPLLRKSPLNIVHSIPLQTIFAAMATNLNPRKSADVNCCIGFDFPDDNEQFTLHIRHGVAEIQPRFPDKPDISVTMEATVWKEIVAGLRNPVVTFAGGHIEIQGGATRLAQMLLLFEKPS